MDNEPFPGYRLGMNGDRYYCDVREGILYHEMLAWLAYVGMEKPIRQVWEHPHPFANGEPVFVTECVWTDHPTLAVEFAEQFGRHVYTASSPYTPDLTGVPQTGMFERRHER